MKYNAIVIGIVFFGILLFGCTSSTPKGDVNAPVSTPEGIQVTEKPQTSPEAKGYTIGETAKTDRSIEITLLKVLRLDCGTSEPKPCIGAFVKLKNIGEKKEQDATIYSPVILDDAGKQYEKGYFTYGCKTESDLNQLYPQASRETTLCFEDVSSSAKKLKLVIPLGLFDRTNVVYEFEPSKIKTPKQSIELEIKNVKIEELSASYNYLKEIEYEVKNTGEADINRLNFDFKISKDGIEVTKKEEAGYLYEPVRAGETASDKITAFESIDAKGEYVLEVTARHYNTPTVLATATKPFTVG